MRCFHFGSGAIHQVWNSANECCVLDKMPGQGVKYAFPSRVSNFCYGLNAWKDWNPYQTVRAHLLTRSHSLDSTVTEITV